jgi:hypothetical protein
MNLLKSHPNKSIRGRALLMALSLVAIGACLLVLLPTIRSALIAFGEMLLHRPLNVEHWQKKLVSMAFKGIFVSVLILILTILFDILVKKVEKILNGLMRKTLFGVSVKEIITEQPFILISLVFILYLVKNIFLATGVTGFDSVVLLMTVLIHGGILIVMYRKNHINPLAYLVVCYGILIFALLINTMIFDYSWDGRWYHQIAAQQLRNGWNPFYENLPETIAFIWANHYPKFTEVFNSIFLSVFGNIELGKSYNIIFLIITFCYVLKYVTTYHKNKFAVLTISILFVMNPVVLTQIFTYYVDGLLGMLIIILFFSCIDYEQKNDIKDIVIIIAVSVFAINTKFTGFICGVVLIVYIIRQLALKKYKQMIRLIVAGVVILLAGVLFTGYNPYITNLRDFGHPFYPLYGDNKIDIITNGNMPEELLSMNPIQRFFSLYLLNYDVSSLPFNPQKIIKLFSHAVVGLRIGGFGVFFMEIFIFVILIVCFSTNKNKERYKTVFFPAALLVCISLITPENWWARYIPAFWYLVGFLIAAADCSVKKNRVLFFLLAVIIIINSFSFFALNTMNGISFTINMKQFIADIKGSDKDTIHIIVEPEYFKYATMEKIIFYGIDKNIIFIEDEEAPFTNGVSFGYIKGWY